MLLGNQVDYIITSNHFIWKSTCIYSVCVYLYIYTQIYVIEKWENPKKEEEETGWKKKEERMEGEGERKNVEDWRKGKCSYYNKFLLNKFTYFSFLSMIGKVDAIN